MKIEAVLSPTELPALVKRDLRNTACVVFDVLRATSTFVTALHHGAKAVVPVSKLPRPWPSAGSNRMSSSAANATA